MANADIEAACVFHEITKHSYTSARSGVRTMWPRHDLMPHTGGRKHYNHPQVGRLILEHVPFSINENPELQMLLFTPVPELDSPSKLRRLIEEFGAK